MVQIWNLKSEILDTDCYLAEKSRASSPTRSLLGEGYRIRVPLW